MKLLDIVVDEKYLVKQQPGVNLSNLFLGKCVAKGDDCVVMARIPTVDQRDWYAPEDVICPEPKA